jgi:hypothetical protein
MARPPATGFGFFMMARVRKPKPHHAALLGPVFGMVLGASLMGRAAAAEISLVPSGAVETIYRWKDGGCPASFIPDSPARAFRQSDGSVMLIAAHYTNGYFAGESFNRLEPRCTIASGGDESPEPERFNDRFWVQALEPLSNGRLFALVSHEYMGKRHPGRCRWTDKPGPQCWYSAILGATAKPGTTTDPMRFALEPPEGRVIAASPTPFDPEATTRTGFFTATNIVRSGTWLYFASWAEFPDTRGNCLLRAPAASPQGPWRAWRAEGFAESLPGAYGVDAHPARCDPVGADRQLGILRSLVWLESARTFVGVFSVANGTRRTPGIYYSLSKDLLTWEEARMLVPLRPWFGTMDCEAFYDYPSLIDPASPSPTFATAGNTLDLYLTRFNWKTCQRGLDRDLVRLRVKVQSDTP